MTRRSKIEARVKQRASQHPDGCDCQTCRAASGDQQAMDRLVKSLI